MQDVVTHFPGHGTLFEEKYLEGKTPKKVIVVKGRIVNLVV